MTPKYWKETEGGREERRKGGEGRCYSRSFPGPHKPASRMFTAPPHRSSPHSSTLSAGSCPFAPHAPDRLWEARSVLTLGISFAHMCWHSVPSLASKSLCPHSSLRNRSFFGSGPVGSQFPFLGCPLASGRSQALGPSSQTLLRIDGRPGLQPRTEVTPAPSQQAVSTHEMFLSTQVPSDTVSGDKPQSHPHLGALQLPGGLQPLPQVTLHPPLHA